MECQYIVAVFSVPERYLKDVRITIVGHKGASGSQELMAPVTMISSPDLGFVWKVELDVDPSILGWFCDKLYIITPEGQSVLFECQRLLSCLNQRVVLYREHHATTEILSSRQDHGEYQYYCHSMDLGARATEQIGDKVKREEYTVSAEISSLYSTNHISIQLIGTDGVSSPKRLSDSPIKITCKPLGMFFLVKLTAKPHMWDIVPEWYCYKVTVTTPEGEIRNFPCYRYLNKKNKEIELTDDHAFIDVPRTHPEIPPCLINQRKDEIEKRKIDFRWKVYAEDLPKIIDADSPFDLPINLWFSFKKDLDMIFTSFKTLLTLEIETLFGWKENWENLDEIKQLLPKEQNKITDYVVQHWEEDEFFVFQLLNGLNPMMIRRCKELPEGAWSDCEKISAIIKKNENLFICNYERQCDLKANIINGEQQYLNSPIVILQLNDGKLTPLAIQTTQDKCQKASIVLNNAENKWNWTLAKTVVRAAEFAEHELNFHLLRTHLLGEVFTVATYRNLPSSHPLFKLLLPHTRYTLFINILARNKLISENGVFASYTAIGEQNAMLTFLKRAMASITYSSLCLPDDIKDRGLENIPHFYYRDDGKCLWNIIQTFVADVLQIFYKSDDDVKYDKELQNWISDIFTNGFDRKEKSGIPSSLGSLKDLYKFVTMIIFTVSGQHAAVNNGQFDYGYWLPNLPSTLRTKPSFDTADASEKTLLAMLPDVQTTVHSLTILKTLSTKGSDYRSLGNYKEELFGKKEVKVKIGEFQERLTILGEGIDMRNRLAPEPGYTFLHPVNVSNSVDL